MKYIKFNNNQIALFSRDLTHRSMARSVETMGGFRAYPVSAGFVTRHEREVFCYGRSESLNLDSNPEDARLIEVLI